MYCLLKLGHLFVSKIVNDQDGEVSGSQYLPCNSVVKINPFILVSNSE